jgi:hypothetical protein
VWTIWTNFFVSFVGWTWFSYLTFRFFIRVSHEQSFQKFTYKYYKEFIHWYNTWTQWYRMKSSIFFFFTFIVYYTAANSESTLSKNIRELMTLMHSKVVLFSSSLCTIFLTYSLYALIVFSQRQYSILYIARLIWSTTQYYCLVLLCFISLIFFNFFLIEGLYLYKWCCPVTVHTNIYPKIPVLQGQHSFIYAVWRISQKNLHVKTTGVYI